MSIYERTKKVLQTVCGQEPSDTQDRLQEDLLMDSLGMVTLLLQIEDEFGIELKESDMNPFDLITVEDVLRLVGRYEVADEPLC